MPRRSRSRSPSSRSRSPHQTNSKRYLDFPPSHQIYVARFSHRTREIDLKRAFEKFGRIESIDLKDVKCFAFIVFQEAKAAKDAIENMNGRSLPHDSERLVVEQAGGNRKKNRRHSRSRSIDRGRHSPSSNDVCYNCNKSGHWAAECKEEISSRRREITEGRCFTCGEKGHKRMECGNNNFNQRKPDRDLPRRRFSESRSRSRSRSPIRNNYGRGSHRNGGSRRYRRRSPSYSQSVSRSPTPKRRSYRRDRRSLSRSRSRSRSPSPPARRGQKRSDERRHYSSRGGRNERRRQTSRSGSVSPRDQKVFKNSRLSNLDDSNTAISTKLTT